MTAYDDFLRRSSRSHDTIEAAVADNCRFDERAGAGRWRRFEDLLSGLVAGRGAVEWPDWTEARDLHLLALQEACDREDFGETFEGRT